MKADFSPPECEIERNDMKQYQIIGLDMDGTLLNSNHQVSKKTQQAIQKARQNGKIVALSTGRGISELIEYESVLQDIQYYICESGGLVYDSSLKKILYQQCFDRRLIQEILCAASKYDAMLYIMSNGMCYAEQSAIENLEYYHMGQYKKMMQETVYQVDNIIELYQKQPMEIEKINIFAASVDIREHVYQELKHLEIEMVYAEKTSLEISPKGVHKGSGLIWLCQHLQIPLEKTIIVGDGENDRAAFQVAGLSIAVGNASNAIKEICDVIVGDHDHDGCAEAIEQYLI